MAAPEPDRAGAGAAAGAGVPRLFIVGGHDSANWLDTVDVFSPGAEGGRWAQLVPQGAPRSFAAAAVLDRMLYVSGGGNGEVWFDSVLRCAHGERCSCHMCCMMCVGAFHCVELVHE